MRTIATLLLLSLTLRNSVAEEPPPSAAKVLSELRKQLRVLDTGHEKIESLGLRGTFSPLGLRFEASVRKKGRSWLRITRTDQEIPWLVADGERFAFYSPLLLGRGIKWREPAGFDLRLMRNGENSVLRLRTTKPKADARPISRLVLDLPRLIPEPLTDLVLEPLGGARFVLSGQTATGGRIWLSIDPERTCPVTSLEYRPDPDALPRLLLERIRVNEEAEGQVELADREAVSECVRVREFDRDFQLAYAMSFHAALVRPAMRDVMWGQGGLGSWEDLVAAEKEDRPKVAKAFALKPRKTK